MLSPGWVNPVQEKKRSNSKSNLTNARKAKQDEFYTQLSDIEKELQHYENHFTNKVVYCNCDDPRVSGFFHYLSHNFEQLSLKKLIATCYKSKEIDLFSRRDSEKAIYLEYSGDKNGNRIPDADEIGIKYLEGDGDFRSGESIKLLQQADVVVTNPPFSLFREYVAQLVEYDKKFLIIGNVNAITYNEIFKLIKQNKLWLGASIHSGDREFGVPNDYPLIAASSRVDEKGKHFIRVKGVRWFTNLDYEERHENLELWKPYTAAEYPKYDNYDAINVDKTKEIPKDYAGVMGVPITFLDKYNPDQFEIVGLGNGRDNFTPHKDYLNPFMVIKSGEKKNGNAINRVLAIESLTKPDETHYMSDNSKYLIAPYARILIRNKRL